MSLSPWYDLLVKAHKGNTLEIFPTAPLLPTAVYHKALGLDPDAFDPHTFYGKPQRWLGFTMGGQIEDVLAITDFINFSGTAFFKKNYTPPSTVGDGSSLDVVHLGSFQSVPTDICFYSSTLFQSSEYRPGTILEFLCFMATYERCFKKDDEPFVLPSDILIVDTLQDPETNEMKRIYAYFGNCGIKDADVTLTITTEDEQHSPAMSVFVVKI